MTLNDAADGIQRAASAAQNGGAVMAFGTGASIEVTRYMGLSLAEWQVAGIVAGIVIGAVGLILNAWITVYFKREELMLKRQAQGDPEE